MNLKRITILLMSSVLLLCGCHSSKKQAGLTYTDVLFDTVISVQILDKADENIINECAKICQKYDVMFSRTNENSEISKINNSGGQPVEVSAETIEIIKTGIYYGDLSNGAFDITIGTVTNLWDFKSEVHNVPADETLQDAVSKINYKDIIIKDNTVQLTNPSMMIDVGALAKGYIADKLKEYLLENGITIDEVSIKVYKTEANANPISSNIYCADPTGVVHNGRLYVYGTSDQQQLEVKGHGNGSGYAAGQRLSDL